MKTMNAPTLTRQDRCDRCGAAALAIVRLASGAELLFCGHHTNEHEAALVAAGATITRVAE